MRRGAFLCACLFAAGCGGLSAAELSSVAQQRGRDSAHGPVRVRWREELTAPSRSTFVPVERAGALLDPARDRMFVGSMAGSLYAMTSGGTRLYRFDAQGAIEASPVLDVEDDELFFGTEQGGVHALRASTGTPIWRRRLEGPVRRAPVLASDAVYVVTDTDVVVALSQASGDLLWTYHREAPQGFSIAGHAGLVLVGTSLLTAFTDGVVVALDASDGHVAWERDTSIDIDTDLDSSAPRFLDVDTTPCVVGDRVYVASFTSGLYGLELGTGSVLLHRPERQGVTAIRQSGQELLLASADEGMVMLDVERDVVVWRRGAERGAPSEPVVARGLVFVGESRGSFLVLDAAVGAERGRIDAGHGFTAAAAVAGDLGVVVSNGGGLYAFSIGG